MAPSNTTKLVSSCAISPPPNSVPNTSVPLTTYDLGWVNAPHIHRIFFYASPLSASPFIDSLKSSLSLTLQHFFTLAGTLRLSPNSDNQLEIHYTEGDSVPFTVVESDDDFHELASGKKRDYLTRIHPLIPPPSGLLAVQVTLFPHQGVCIGYTLHHVAADGPSISTFMKSWSSTCKLAKAPTTPIYDRDLIIEPPGVYSTMYDEMIQRRPITPSSSPSLADEAVLALFTLRREQIDRLKRKVMASGEHSHCSTFVVSCAYAWVCHVRALGYSSDETAYFLFAVNCRARLDPPVPPEYFGNCLKPRIVEESVQVIKGPEGFVAAAIRIGKAVEGLKGGVKRGVEEAGTKLKAIAPEKLLSVSGSPQLRVYEVDFGWGRPVKSEVPSIKKSGGISLSETKEFDGGVEIGLALGKDKMEEFEAHFYGGLD